MNSRHLRSALVGAAITLPSSAFAVGTVLLDDGAGRVEVLRDTSAPPVGILPGEVLTAGALRTGDGARARLKTDDGDQVDFEANTQASLEAGDAAQVGLTAGKIDADGTHGSRSVQVHAGPTVVVEGKAAQFSVSVGKKGEIAVSSGKGSLSVTSGTQSAQLAEGKSCTIPKNGKLPADLLAMAAPTAPPTAIAPTPPPEPVAPVAKPVPAKAEEKPAPVAAPVAKAEKPAEPPPAPTPAAPPTVTVDWPASAVEGSTKIKGSVTGSGVAVTVNGVKAKVRSGKFEAKVDLAQGDQPVDVHAVDGTGQEVDAKQTITVAAKPEEKPAPAAEAGSDEGSATEGDAASKKKSTSKPKVKQEASGWE